MDEQRKHFLINLNTHTSGNLPVGKLRPGEIAVDHSSVENAKIFVETNSENPTSATLATFVTKDYIENITNRLTSGETILANAIESLTDIVLTGGSGDAIINVEVSDISGGTTPNTFIVKHKKGTETNGFKKLSTDEYGHVTASTDVTAEEIIGLLVNNSGNTGEGALVYDKATSSVTYYNVITDIDDFIALSATTSGVSTGSLVDAGLISKCIIENEEVTAAALNKLNDDIKGLSNDFLSADTPHITSISEVENASGKTTTINYFNGTEETATTIVEKYIIDCGEY